MTKSKRAKDAQIEMREMVLPQHTNPQNTIFGGVVMSWVDIAASMCASRFAERPVVTVHIDSLSFKAPIKMGYHVRILAAVNWVGQSSMEIGVKVMGENPLTGESRTTTTAYLTFVALDDLGRPTQVPRLILDSEEERRRFENATKRVQIRKKFFDELKKGKKASTTASAKKNKKKQGKLA